MAQRASGVGRGRRWVGVGVGVELVAELHQPEPGGQVQVVEVAHDRGADRVEHEPGLGLALFASGGYRVGDLLGEVAVGWAADVVALLGVLLEPVPGFFQGFERVPLGHALLDPAGE